MQHLLRLLGALAAGALLGLAIAACGGASSAAGSEATPVTTTLVDLPKSYRFAPAAIVVTAGATVTWTNSDNFTHSIQFEGDASPGSVMRPGETASHAFDKPGAYPYVCAFHPQNMKGTVLVTASGTETP